MQRLLPLLVALPLAGPSEAQTPLTTELVASGLPNAILLLSPPDDDRLFVVVQSGTIRIIEDGTLLPTPFLDISSSVNHPSFGSEQGLLTMAFHPDYADNGQFYVYYTGFAGPIGGNTILERYTVSAGNPNVADAGSACTLFSVTQPFTNHNGGHLAFGPDGMLYLSLGDGGSGNDPSCRAQNPTIQLGKMVRIAVDPATCGFSIPPDNPFIGMGGQSNRVFHVGLRNPFRFSFDRLTGDMYIGDVGQDVEEEVSFAPAGVAGVNFGWRVMEGNDCNGLGACPGGTPPCNDPAYTAPIHTYPHPGAGVCAVTGGYVYRGCAIPDLQGTYFFADVCSNQIWSFRWDGASKTDFMNRTTELAPSVGGSIDFVVSFGEDRFGELYLVELTGQIWKVVADGVVAGRDCDLNGQVDSCELASGYATDFDSNMVVDPCDPLSEDSNFVAFGTSVNFQLNAGASHAGDFYWLLGSATGTSPGWAVGTFTMPLNFDPYTVFTLKHPLDPVFTTIIGFLDGEGRGTAAFNVPAGLDPDLAGITLFHAYALSADSMSVNFVSNAVPVTSTL